MLYFGSFYQISNSVAIVLFSLAEVACNKGNLRGNYLSTQVIFLSGFVQMCAYSVVPKNLVLLLALRTCFVVKLPSIGGASLAQFQFAVVGRLLVGIHAA